MKKKIIGAMLIAMIMTLGISAFAYNDNIRSAPRRTARPAQGDMAIFAVDNIYATSVLPSSSEHQITDAINSAIENITRGEITVDLKIPYSSSSELSAILNDVWTIAERCLNENPLWFTVDRDKTLDVTDPDTGQTISYIDYLSISYITSWDDDCIEELILEFSFEDNAETMLHDFKVKADEVIAYMNSQGVTENSPDFDKALWLHDYIATNCEYDTDYVLRSAYDALVLHKSVCEGYACSYKYLLSLAGVECMNAYNTAAAHEWSLVKIDGKWYHIDVTHDDPLADFIGKVTHTHFMIANADILDGVSMSSGDCYMHTEWFTANGYTSENADSTFADTTYQSDAMWRNTKSSIAFVGDNRYFIRYDKTQRYQVGRYIYTGCAKIVKCDKDMNVLNDTYYQIESPWYASNGSNVYQDYFTGLGAYGTAIYYNTYLALMKIDTSSEPPKAQAVYTHLNTLEADNQLFGSYLYNNLMYYGIVNFVNGSPTTVFEDRKYVSFPTLEPTTPPTEEPTSQPTNEPTQAPTPTPMPTDEPTQAPTSEPTAEPTAEPTQEPTAKPTQEPTSAPDATPAPTIEPIGYPYTISGISILTEGGIPLSAIPSESSYIINVNITKNLPQDNTGYIIAAGYDSSQVLVKLMYAPIDQGNEHSYNFLVSASDKKITEIRAFVWSSLNSQTPLCEKDHISFK